MIRMTDEYYKCSWCDAKSISEDLMRKHESICGCNPEVVERISGSGVVGKVFKTCWGGYYKVMSVHRGYAPLRGVYVRESDRMIEIDPRHDWDHFDESCGAPAGTNQCTDEEVGRLADRLEEIAEMLRKKE